MNLPSNSDFFNDLDVLNIQKDEYCAEIEEQTKASEQKIDDTFNVEDADVIGDNGIDVDKNVVGSGINAGGLFANSSPAPTSKYTYTYDKQARSYVKMLNVGNKAILPKIYKKKLLTKEERTRLKEIDISDKQGITYLSEQDVKLQKKFEDVKQLIDAIPFTEDEIKELADALEEVLKMTNAPSSPVFTLIVALITIEGARILPILNFAK